MMMDKMHYGFIFFALFLMLSENVYPYSSGKQCRQLWRFPKLIGTVSIASCTGFTVVLPHPEPSFAFSRSGEIIYRDEDDGEELQQQSFKEQLKAVQVLQLQEQEGGEAGQARQGNTGFRFQ